MLRPAVVFLILALGIEFQLSRAVEVSVKDKDGKLCLYGKIMANFSVSYDAIGSVVKTVEFPLPDSVLSDGSLCNITESVLKLDFGDGHSWSLTFTKTEKSYHADAIIFSYNLNDSTIFPNSSSKEIKSVSVVPHIMDINMDTCYLCNSRETLEADSVNQTLWNVVIQAFVNNGSKSDNYTTCAADLPTTPVAPTTQTPNTTSAAPVTNITTAPPVPTTTPTPPLPLPERGNYVVKTGENGTVCLLAAFGLRIGFIEGGKYEEMNLDPNTTTVNGICRVNSSELLLTSNSITVMFSFFNDTNKFHLSALNVTAKSSSGVVFNDGNATLDLWEATVGSSYLCNAKQNYSITPMLTLYTFNLQVQPFGVKGTGFSTAHECALDDSSILIPIAVGAALAGLILIVVIAYLIGRRKTYVGYQTL